MNDTIVLIGAGSAMFGLGTLGDIFQSEALHGSTIVLHDINPQALRKVEEIARRTIAERDLPFTLAATASRREALQDATFCIISVAFWASLTNCLTVSRVYLWSAILVKNWGGIVMI